jgi:hypothetical protein
VSEVRPAKIAAIWLAPGLILLLLTTLVTGHYRIEPRAPTAKRLQQSLLECLRSQLEGGAGTSSLDGAVRDWTIVRLYNRGSRVARLVVQSTSLAELCERAGQAMQMDPAIQGLPLLARKQIRIQVDHISGRGPLLQDPELLASLALHPALDGIGVSLGDKEYFLLPSETIDANLLSSNRPLSFVPDFVFGFDQEKADILLRSQAGMNNADWSGAEREYFRFRSESYVESQLGESLPLTRGMIPAPEMSEESLREGAIEGGRYLVAHMAANGRYIYLANMATGRQTDPRRGGYSLPRHAGTTYFLAELYRITKEPFLVEPIERAIGHLADLVVEGGCGGTTKEGKPFVCVSDRGSATSDLGSTALAVVALAEYKRATGSSRFEGLMTEMAEFLLYMQRKDGSFAHRYNVKTRTVDQEAELLYYSGEASLALARMHVVTGEQRFLDATEKGLDWLVGWYDFFLGGFFYGEEHWTCIAAEAISEALYKEKYWTFCEGYGDFLRSHQPQPGEFQDQQDWVGAYYFTPFLAPQNTPAGSRTEAMISTYELGATQIELAMRFSLSQQLRRDSLFSVPPHVNGRGAVSGSPIDRAVRIDYVQHVCSAMIRTAEILRREALPGENSQR